MTYFSFLSQPVQRSSMPVSVPSHFLPSFRQSSATAMAYQKRPWHQKTDRFGVEVQIKRNRSPQGGRISSGHTTALQAVAAWRLWHNRSTALAFFPTGGVCYPISPTRLGTAGNRVVGPNPPKTPTSSTRQTPPRDADSRGQSCARSDPPGFSAC